MILLNCLNLHFVEHHTAEMQSIHVPLEANFL